MANSSYHAIVVGLGAWGSAALYHLAKRGKRVLGLDQYRVPHRFGSSHGHGRVIRIASPESPLYTPLMRRSYDLWGELERETGRTLINEVGGLYVGEPDSEIVEGSLASYEGTDIEHRVLDAAEIRRQFPAFTVLDTEVGVFEPGAGRLDPEGAIAAHLEAAAKAGAEIRFEEAITGWSGTSDGVTVTTGSGVVSAEQLVLAVGPWAPEVLRMTLPLEVERQIVVRWPEPSPSLPIFVLPCDAPYEVFYGMPEPGAIKAAFHHGGAIGSVDTLSREVTPAEIAEIQEYLAWRVSVLSGEPLEVFTCLYTNTPDRHYVIGRHPESERVVVATGCNGRGFKMATIVGEGLADLVEGKARPDLEFVSPARFGVGAS